jgi:hypothetical protein
MQYNILIQIFLLCSFFVGPVKLYNNVSHHSQYSNAGLMFEVTHFSY